MRLLKTLGNAKRTNPIDLAIENTKAAVFAPNRILANHTGPVLRIARDEDETETNIGIDNETGEFDITTYKQFMQGSAYGEIVDFFDQNSGKHHAYTDVEAERAFLHYIDPRSRKYLKFNGASSYVSIGNPASVNNIWSGGGKISLWFFVNKQDNGVVNTLVSKRTLAPSLGYDIDVRFGYNGTFQIYMNTIFSNSGSYVNTTESFDSGKWYKLEVEYNSDSTTNVPSFKVDVITQVLEGYGTNAGTLDDSSLGLRLGYDVSTSTRFLDGYIADFKAYKSTGLTADYKLDEESGTVATDYANGNNRPIYNGSWEEEVRHIPEQVLDFNGYAYDDTPDFNQIVLPQSTLFDNIWTGGGAVTADVYHRGGYPVVITKDKITSGLYTTGWTISFDDRSLAFYHHTEGGGTQAKVWKTDTKILLNTHVEVKVEFNKDSILNAPLIYFDNVLQAITLLQDSTGIYSNDSSCFFMTIASNGEAANNRTANYGASFDGAISNVKIYKTGVLSASYLPSNAKDAKITLPTATDFSGNGLDGIISGAIPVNTGQAKIKIKNNTKIKLKLADGFYHDWTEFSLLRVAQQCVKSSDVGTFNALGKSPSFEKSTDGEHSYFRSLLTTTFNAAGKNGVVRVGTQNSTNSWVSGSIISSLVAQTITSNVLLADNVLKVFNNNTGAITDNITPSVTTNGVTTVNNLIDNTEIAYPAADYLLSNICLINKVLSTDEQNAIDSLNRKREGTL